jgi:P pilus assembly chaperone PapD
MVRNNKFYKYNLVVFFCILFSFSSHLVAEEINANSKSFVLKLGLTRIIYDPESNGKTLLVSNPQDYPILVQSQVLAEDNASKAPFLVTPPLFRLEGGQQSKIRIIHTNGSFSNDKETLYWTCVKGIPPKVEDNNVKKLPEKAEVNIMISINNCIKLIVRPSGVKGMVTDVADKLVWTVQNGTLRGDNPTPFYMNL